MVKPITVESAPYLFSTLIILGIVLGSISVSAVFSSPDLGGWSYLLLPMAILLLTAGILWMIGYLSKVQKFYDLIDETSKSAFLKKLDDIEYLAWRLPSKYEDVLAEKKKELKIR